MDIADKPGKNLLNYDLNINTVAKSAFSSVIIQLIVRLKGLITTPIYTYFLLPNELGHFNLIMVTSGLLVPLVTLNLMDGPQVLFSHERSRDKIHKMYMTMINLSMCLSLSFIGLFSICIYMSRKGLLEYLPWVALLMLSNILARLPVILLVTYQHTGLLVRNTMQRDIGITITSIALVFLGYSYKGLLLSNICFNFITAILLLRVTFQELPYYFTINTEAIRLFFKVSLPLLPVFMFSWLIQSSDSYFLAYYSGEETVGKYSVVYSITSIIICITYALNLFWNPVSNKLWLEKRERYKQLFKLIFIAICVIQFIAVVGFELNAKNILHLLVRNSQYYDAYIIIGMIAFSYAMQVLLTLLTAPLYANLNTRSIMFSYLAGGILNVVLNFCLIPSMGIIGAAISTALSYLMVVIIISYANYRYAAFDFLDKRIYYVTASFILAWSLSVFLRNNISQFQAFCVTILLLLAGCFLFLSKGMTADEKSFCKEQFIALRQKSKASV